MSWSDFSMARKAELIKEAVAMGIKDLSSIRKYYNEYKGGGWLEAAKKFIKSQEGWVPKPYTDTLPGHNWRSVGYGFNDSGFYAKYPEGISNHYSNGITKEQAEEELDWAINNLLTSIRSTYGSQVFDSLTDGQKIALLDNVYQRGPTSVNKRSAFYKAFTSGDPDAGKYLMLSKYPNRSNARYKLWGGDPSSIPTVSQEDNTGKLELTPVKTETIKYELPDNLRASLALTRALVDGTDFTSVPAILTNNFGASIPETNISDFYKTPYPISSSRTKSPLELWHEVQEEVAAKPTKVVEEISPNWGLFTGRN